MEEDFLDNIRALGLTEEDRQFEASLRPQVLKDFVGLSNIKPALHVMIESAKKRNAALDHILFYGPPGLGKTSLAMALGNEMQTKLIATSGPAMARPGDLAAILTSIPEKAILFIDEIHRLKKPLEELLYSAMEDRFLDLVIGKGGGARSIRVDLPQFTLIGATTKPAMLSAPLRSRFGAEFRLNFYTPDELSEMIMSKSSALEIQFGRGISDALSIRSRMTARIAVRLLKRLRDWITVHQLAEVKIEDIENMLNTLGVDLLGLDDLDRRILASMYYKFNNRAIGLNTIAASLSEDPETIESVCEPFLLQLGLIERTPRGRVLTANAVQYIEQNPDLFINLK